MPTEFSNYYIFIFCVNADAKGGVSGKEESFHIPTKERPPSPLDSPPTFTFLTTLSQSVGFSHAVFGIALANACRGDDFPFVEKQGFSWAEVQARQALEFGLTRLG